MNRLTAHVTTWRAWYAVLAMSAFVLSSFAAVAGAAFTPLSFLLFAALSLLFIAVASRRWPSRLDLGLRRGLTVRDIVVVLVVFAVTHLSFWLLGMVDGGAPGEQAARLFTETGLDGPLLPAVVVSSVVLAPVCEEILYRGAMLRPLHDSLARRGRGLGAVIGITVSTLFFAMPHLAEDTINVMSIAYLLTGAGLGLVYVLTGSLTGAMLGHSLQSMVVFGQVLIFGCPIWVYLGSQLVRVMLPRR